MVGCLSFWGWCLMAKRVLEVQITGDTRSLDRALGKSQKGMSGFAKSAAKTGALVGAAGLGAAVVESAKAFEEHRKVVAETDAVLKSTGNAANTNAKHIAALAGAIQKKTAIDDESIQSGENMLLTFKNVRNETGKGNKIFDQATKVMVDMSAKFGTDAPTAAVRLGKALNDPIKGITALTRVGVTFSQKQKDQIKSLVEHGKTLDAQKIILRELNSEFKGTAEAHATPLAKLKDSFGELEETIGGKLAPALDKGARALTGFINGLNSPGGGGKFFASIKNDVTSAVAYVKRSLGLSSGDISKFAHSLANIFNFVKPTLVRVLGGIRDIFGGALRVIGGTLKVFTGVFTGDWKRMWDGVKTIARGVVGVFGGIAKAVLAPFAEVGKAVGRALSAPFTAAKYVVGKSIAFILAGMSSILGGFSSILRAAGHIPGIGGKFNDWADDIDHARRKIDGTAHSLSNLEKHDKVKARVDVVDNASKKIQKVIATMQALKRISTVQNVLDIVSHLKPQRKGGKAFAEGGLVPSVLSPGELGVLPGGGAFTVPGQRVAADTVPMMLPSGTSIFTDSGQGMLASGASMGQALAMQAPHFAKGGTVKGRVSWFGGPHDSSDSGRTAGGFTTGTPGVAIRPGDSYMSGKPYLSYAGKPWTGFWDIHLGKHHAVLPQTDIGPNQSTGRRIDFTYSALSKMGFNEGNFPTDAVGTAKWLGKSRKGSSTPGPSTTGTKFTPAPNTHPLLSSLLTPLTDTALGAGTDPPTRDSVLSAVLEGIVPDSSLYGTRAKVSVPGASGKRGSSGGGKATAAAFAHPGKLHGVGTWGGKAVDNWIIPYLNYGRKHGWSGGVNSGYRSYADQLRIWNSGVRPAARPGTSNHEGANFPRGAVDVSDAPGLERAISGIKGRYLHYAGAKDPVHFSYPHNGSYRRGGLVGFRNGGSAQILRARQLQAAYRRTAAGKKHPHTLSWFVKQLAGRPGQAGADAFTRQFAKRLKGRSTGALLRQQKAIAKRIAAKLRSGHKLTPTEQIQVKRLQGARTLVENELGYPIDAALNASDRAQAEVDHDSGTFDDRMTIQGVEEGSPEYIAQQKLETQAALDKVTRAQAGNYSALTLARRTGNPAAIKQAEDELQENNDKMLSLRAALITLNKTVSDTAQDTLAAQKENTEAILALQKSVDEQNRYANAIQSIETGTAMRALADMLSGQLGPRVAIQAQSAGSGDVARRY